jgi:hypothetical protein
MSFINIAWDIFNQSITDYHKYDNVDQPMSNPFEKSDINYLLYEKNWIDTVQWHLEDIIRDPNINPKEALKIKRRIDNSNQDRTNKVEQIDDWFLLRYKEIKVKENAELNTESPAWAIDRLSILALKIYHMKEETDRSEATESHKKKCHDKLQILVEQHKDLSLSIENLIYKISQGEVFMKVYRQMKMYNDEELNPVLYNNKN